MMGNNDVISEEEGGMRGERKEGPHLMQGCAGMQERLLEDGDEVVEGRG